MKYLFLLFIITLLGSIKSNAQETDLSLNLDLYFKYQEKGNYELASIAINKCAHYFEDGNYNLDDTNYAYVKAFQSNIFEKLGHFKEAIESENTAKLIFEKYFGKYSDINKFSCHNLASLYAKEKQYELSNYYYLELLQLNDSLNKDIANIYYLIYSQYSFIKRYDLAIEYALKAIEANTNIFGMNNLVNSNINEDISRFYSSIGNYEKSIDFGMKSLLQYGQIVSEKDSIYASKLFNIALLNLNVDSLQKGKMLAEQSISIFKSIHGEVSYKLANYYQTLAYILSREGNTNEAIVKYQEALELFAIDKLKNKNKITEINIALGLKYMKINDYDRAISYFEKVDIEENNMHNNIDLANLSINIGMCYNNNYSYQKAINSYEKGIYLLRLIDSIPSLYTSTLLNNLSGIYSKIGQYDKSIDLNEKSLEIINNLIGKHNRQYGISLNNLALLYSKIGLYDESIKLNKEAYDILLETSGAVSEDIALCLNNSGLTYQNKGNYSQAFNLLEQALLIRQKLLNDIHPDVITSMNNLAAVYYDLGEYNKAIKLYQQALDNANMGLEANNPIFENIISNLALCYDQIGMHQEAIKLNKKVLDIRISNYGENHQDVAISLQNLAAIYSKLGQYEEAISLFNEALKIFKNTFGDEHLNIAMCLNNLALTTGMFNKNEAISLHEQTLDMRLKILDEKHPDVANSMINLASMLIQNGEYGKAEKMLLKSLKINLDIFGAEHYSIAVCYNDLASLYCDIGQYDKSLDLHFKSLNLRKKLFGVKHPAVALSYNNLARLHMTLGEISNAIDYNEKALNIYTNIYGTEHPDVALSLSNLAIIYDEVGQFQKALKLHEEALKINKLFYGESHKSVAISLNNLACTYANIGNFDKTKYLLDESLLLFGKKSSYDSLELATIYANSGCFYAMGGYFEEALKLHEDALKIRLKILGVNNIEIAICYNNIADVFYRQGNLQLSLNNYKKAIDILVNTATKYSHVTIKTYQNLAYNHIKMGSFNNAVVAYSKAMNIIKSSFDINFHCLNEKEKSSFINNFDEIIGFYFGLSFRYEENDIHAMRNLISNSLFFNYITLRSNETMRKSILTSNDTLLINDFKTWLGLKRQYANAQSLSLDELKNEGIDLKAMEDSIEIKERSLSQKSQAFQTEQQKLELNYETLKSNLKAEEATVMFHSFNYYNGKDWTDSILYTAYIIRKNQKYPEMVYLFEQAALDTLLPAPDTRSMMNNLYQTGDSALYNLVWKPLEPYLKGVKTAYVAPSGLLHKIAFVAVPLPDGSRLSDRYQLRQVLSGHDVVFKEDPAVFNNSSNTSVALLGGINYEYLPEAKDTVYFSPLSLLPESTDRGTAFGYLPGTESEVSSIEQMLKNDKVNVTLLKGNNASEEQFKTLQGDKAPKVLHIATHGFFAPDPKRDLNKENSMRLMGQENRYTAADNPLYRSGLLLAGGNSSWTKKTTLPADQDGVLTAYEVANMDLSNTQLVVLSACETALGDVKGREGVFGLQRGFRLAGAKYMLMSLWRIPDKETAEYMTKFYSELAKTNNIVTAYQTTQNHMKATYPNEPQIWAGMVLVE